MKYYRVPIRVTEEGKEPDIPAVSFVGNRNDTAYLIKTPADLKMQPVTNNRYFGEIKLNANLPEIALQTVAEAMGLDADEVLNIWHVEGA